MEMLFVIIHIVCENVSYIAARLHSFQEYLRTYAKRK